MSTLMLITLAAVCNSAALAILKFVGDQFRLNPRIAEVLLTTWWMLLISIILYAISFALTIRIFTDSTFSKAVPTFIGFSVLFALLIAVFYFKESVSAGAFVGCALIVSGVWLVQTGIS